jgi:hypothetical protein
LSASRFTGYYGAPPTVTLDPGAHEDALFEFSVDGGPWKAYEGAFSIAQPTEGEHIVRFRGSDGSFAADRFAMDTEGPGVTAEPASAPNEHGWYREDVTVRFFCADAVAGVDGCPAPHTFTAEGAEQSVSRSVTDRAGNSGSGGIGGINIDRTAPTITGSVDRPPNPDGWYDGPVTVSFACADALSGVADCPADVVLSAEGANQSVERSVTDRAGNTASATVGPIGIDATDPEISGTPDRPANAAGWYGAPVIISWNCTDALSGIASCSAPQTVAEAEDASVSGQATDRAGNQATATVDHIRVDATDPTVTITSGGVLVLSRVRGTASDADASDPRVSSGVADVRITYTSGGRRQERSVGNGLTLDCAPDHSCTWAAEPPPLGVWEVEAVAVDRAGRAGPAARTTLSVNL